MQRVVYAASGAICCEVSAPISFTAWYTIYEMKMHGAKPEDLKLHDMTTEREMGIIRVLNYLTVSGGAIGGILGAVMGKVPKFSFLKLLKVGGATTVAGIGVTIFSTLFASHIMNSLNEWETPKEA
jgi:hypothetical protein